MVIVGAGECGIRAALALREEGYGGPVTLIGAEKHLPYERPPLSKASLAEPEPKLTTIATEERLFEAGIVHLRGVSAAAIDREARAVRLEDGRTLHFGKLLLATGASPRRLPMAQGLRHVMVLRTYDDARAIRARLAPETRLAVIGGGFIGLELAAAARRMGVAVTVIEAQSRLLARAVPAAIAGVIAQAHEREGVRFLLDARIAGLEEAGETLRIRLESEEAVEADLCVVGIGAEPETRLAAEAGLAVENGIAVDASLRTSDPDIFAAGDCCSFPSAHYDNRRVRLEAWRNAQEQGSLAAKNMLGGDGAHEAVPWFWSDQYELGLQIAGLADAGATTVRRDLGEDAFILFHLDEAGRLIAASGIGPGNAVAKDIRLAEMLIARGAKPDPARLAAPETKLKALLAA
ncbi:MAG: ferredoxin reductase [Mesorhizobium amorphae]|nr:MAG: ferredoxin reductase [Mesorhizobium amorphae]